MKTHVQHPNSMMAAMQTMMEEMSHASLHGDPDNHFARIMQLHHAGALSMGELVLQDGRDLTMAGIARNMLQKQKEEIAALQVFLNNHRPIPHTENATFNTEMKKQMESMDLTIEQNELTGNVDHDFAALMVHHHHAAIDMAELIIQHGADPDIKRMAGMMKADQETEIDILHKWLNDHKPVH